MNYSVKLQILSGKIMKKVRKNLISFLDYLNDMKDLLHSFNSIPAYSIKYFTRIDNLSLSLKN